MYLYTEWITAERLLPLLWTKLIRKAGYTESGSNFVDCWTEPNGM